MQQRYLESIKTKVTMTLDVDVIIVGAGIAGLFTALGCREDLRVIVLSKDVYKNCNSYRAQGGIACVVDDKLDDMDKHFNDTMICGHNKNNPEAVRILVGEGAANIETLLAYGVPFDRKEDGSIALGREGAHSENRILHVGDYTGKSIMDHLYNEVTRRPNIRVYEDAFVIDVMTSHDVCRGVYALISGEGCLCRAPQVVLATGGIGRLFGNSTNADISTGDGIAMADRAGAKLANMSYVQFHPTVFYDVSMCGEIFLISEAVRGEGAKIRNHSGEAFMDKIHVYKDLAPRDVVSNAIFKQMKSSRKPYVFLDSTHQTRDFLEKRFPFIYGKCSDQGYRMERDFLPIAPMMHYFMGGIQVDCDGRTNIEGLFACGECAHTGVHGANRLASNSLLEAIVFGNRIAGHLSKNENQEMTIHDTGILMRQDSRALAPVGEWHEVLREKLNGCYMGRHRMAYAKGLNEAYKNIAMGPMRTRDRQVFENMNMYQVFGRMTKELMEDIIDVEQTANG